MTLTNKMMGIAPKRTYNAISVSQKFINQSVRVVRRSTKRWTIMSGISNIYTISNRSFLLIIYTSPRSITSKRENSDYLIEIQFLIDHFYHNYDNLILKKEYS